MKRFLGMCALVMIAIIAGCGTVTEVAEVPVEVIEVPTETDDVVETSPEEPAVKEINVSVKATQSVEVTAATAVGLQDHVAPQVGVINSATERPVNLKIRGSDAIAAKSTSTVVGAPEHGFRVGRDALAKFGDTDRETDIRVKARFNHRYSSGSVSVGAPEPGLKVE